MGCKLFKQKKHLRIALIGKPNVGKSTIFNRLAHYKAASTSEKPHTTKHSSVLGIQYNSGIYIEYIDTPGFRKEFHTLTQEQIDLVCIVCERYQYEYTRTVVDTVNQLGIASIVCINKIDKFHVTNLTNILSNDWYRLSIDFDHCKDVCLMSGKHGHNLECIERLLSNVLNTKLKRLAKQKYNDLIQNISIQAYEQLFRLYHAEIPHTTRVQVESQADNAFHVYLISRKRSQAKILRGDNYIALRRLEAQLNNIYPNNPITCSVKILKQSS